MSEEVVSVHITFTQTDGYLLHVKYDFIFSSHNSILPTPPRCLSLFMPATPLCAPPLP